MFRRPVRWLANRFSSAPRQQAVNNSLSRLFKSIVAGKRRKGLILEITAPELRMVIMSDHHKGAGDKADDFVKAEKNYMAALRHYEQQGFIYVALGDVEELWENDMQQVFDCYQHHLPLEKVFVDNQRFYKIYGNHDLLWQSTGRTNKGWLQQMYGQSIPVHEGLLVKIGGLPQPLQILLTHGHQGDRQSDGNRFSKWFVSMVWSKVQAFLDVNVNTPAKDFSLRDRHNIMMYEWCMTQPHTLLITGHTHKPVFASLSHLEKLKRDLLQAEQASDLAAINQLRQEINRRAMEDGSAESDRMKKPCYFNSGCCCFSDGDITAIEIVNGFIRLVKWTAAQPNQPVLLQEAPLSNIAEAL